MLARKAISTLSWLFIIIGFVVLSGCAQPPGQPAKEEPPAPQNTEASISPSQPAEMPKLPPPRLEEVREAVNRVFKDAVVIDPSRKPGFLVGDFNGDQSQDLAIVLKPAEGKLSELNQEFPNWIAREPLEEVLPRPNALAQPVAAKLSPGTAAGQTVRFHQSDVLLAIIHGYGPRGWQDPEATQTHLLRNVVGSNMRRLPFVGAVKAYKGRKPFPTIYGDLIQQTLIGQSGFLHFAGAIYSWYDPKNYNPVPVSMAGHANMSRMR